jgi:hypothetical protein
MWKRRVRDEQELRFERDLAQDERVHLAGTDL